jgi:prepilin-type N-terminal cleavage/methylation domain-containing protein
MKRQRGFSSVSQRGFSLVELMISLALFGLIASGALALVMSGTRTQAHSARVDVAQSGLRAGLDFITRDILSASAGASTGSLVLASSGAVVQPIVVTDGGANGPDTIEIYTIEAAYIGTVSTAVAAGDTSISIVLNDANYPFAAGDLVQLCDLTQGTLVRLTSPVTNTTLTGTVANLPGGLTGFGIGSYVFKTRHVKYSIGANAFGTSTSYVNTSALMMDLFDGVNGANNPQPLAEGIEDLQVALAVDANTDGTIAIEDAATANGDEWVLNNSAEAVPATNANLKAVRITLVAKSSSAEKGTFPVRPAAEDRVAAGTTDGFFRRVVRSEAAVRNFNL